LITISHSHADGTNLSGSRKGDGVFDIVRHHGFRSSPDVGLYIRGTRDRDAPRHQIDAAAEALRQAGFEVTVDIDDQWRPAAVREAAAAERTDERADIYHQHADSAAGRRDAREAAAHQILDGIPAGQPPMPDHHSYQADRNRRDRALAHHDAARDENRTAAFYADKAAGVTAHADAKDNPRAIMRRIETLQASLRGWQRELAEAEQAGTSDSYQQRCRREITRLDEDITHQQEKLAARADSGEFVAWSPQNLAKGDVVRGEFGWYLVTRVSKKSVSLDNGKDWPQRLTYDKIYGRRRDGLQLDKPNGRPWPQQLAEQVARWFAIERGAANPGYDDVRQRQARHVGYARRLVHGLDLTATDRQVQAFSPGGDGPAAVDRRRRLRAAYLAVFDRLEAGEPVPDIAAGLTPQRDGAAWVMPDGDPVDRKPRQLAPGDIIAGIWDTGHQGRTLWPHFCGPVAQVSVPVAHSGREWVTVTLTDGSDKEMTTSRWLAVHPAAPAAE
jgi:hypothetical protein